MLARPCCASEGTADFKAFGDGGLDLLPDFLRGAVVQVLGRDHVQLAQAPEMAQGPYVGGSLLERVPGVDVHAPGGDIEHTGTSAQAVALPVVAVESDVEQGHVLEKHLQCAREAHVPERGGYYNPVRRGNPSGHVRILHGHNAAVPVVQDPAVDNGEARPVEPDGLYVVSPGKFRDYREGYSPGPGFFPHRGVYENKSVHCPGFKLSRLKVYGTF